MRLHADGDTLAAARQYPRSFRAGADMMVDTLTLSAAGLALLEMVELLTGVSFEVVHLQLDPLGHSLSRNSSPKTHEPGVSEDVLKSLRTGEVRLGQAREMTYGVFPLRRSREIVGCLIASLRSATQE